MDADPKPPVPETGTKAHGPRLERILFAAGCCGLIGLLLTVLPMAKITPLTLALSFAVGQPLCVFSLGLFVLVVVLDLRGKRVL